MSVSSTCTGGCAADGRIINLSSQSGTSFETVTDIPQDLNDIIASRWWEEKALHTLPTTTNLYEIRLICQHIPFADQNAPSVVLSRNWTHTHDTFLTILEADYCPDSDQCIKADGLSSDRKAEELVRLLMSDKSDSVPIQAIFWCPPQPFSNKAPSSIAEEWISVFGSMLAEISWEDWMSMALGHDTTAICSLLERSQNTSVCLRKSMNGLASSENKYYLVNLVSSGASSRWCQGLIMPLDSPLSKPPCILDHLDLLRGRQKESSERRSRLCPSPVQKSTSMPGPTLYTLDRGYRNFSLSYRNASPAGFYGMADSSVDKHILSEWAS